MFEQEDQVESDPVPLLGNRVSRCHAEVAPGAAPERRMEAGIASPHSRSHGVVEHQPFVGGFLDRQLPQLFPDRGGVESRHQGGQQRQGDPPQNRGGLDRTADVRGDGFGEKQGKELTPSNAARPTSG